MARSEDNASMRRQRQRARRLAGEASGFDDKRLYSDILAAQQGLVSQGQKIGREAQQAALAAGAIEGDKLFRARGLNRGTEEVLRGAMSAGSAQALGEAEAKREADLLKQAQGIGTQMVEREAAKASRRAEKKARRAGEAGTFASMLGSLGGLASGAGSILPGLIPAVAAMPGPMGALPGIAATAAGGPAALPLAIGGLIASGIGAAAGAGAQNERSKADKELAAISKKASEFEGPSTQGIENVLSAGPGYEGFQSSFLGGQGSRRPRRIAQESSPYEGYLDSLYSNI